MENAVTNGDERWQAWVAVNGWTPCEDCDSQGYTGVNDNRLTCHGCAGFGFADFGFIVPKED